MKTKFEFINFVYMGGTGKTTVWYCFNNKSCVQLGNVRWAAPWRQYVFYPANETLFSAGCLADIITFIGELKNFEGR